MSTLRPTLIENNKPSGYTTLGAFHRILSAVKGKRRLLHGALGDGDGHFCAVGCAFDDGVHVLPTDVVEEVSIFNDSFPRLSRKRRWKKVIEWLQLRIDSLEVQ